MRAEANVAMHFSSCALCSDRQSHHNRPTGCGIFWPLCLWRPDVIFFINPKIKKKQTLEKNIVKKNNVQYILNYKNKKLTHNKTAAIHNLV